MRNANTVKDYFECTCGSFNHTMRMQCFDDESPNDEGAAIYCDVSLDTNAGVLKRFWLAIRYVLRARPSFGHYEEFLFEKTEVVRMRDFLDRWLNQQPGRTVPGP